MQACFQGHGLHRQTSLDYEVLELPNFIHEYIPNLNKKRLMKDSVNIKCTRLFSVLRFSPIPDAKQMLVVILSILELIFKPSFLPAIYHKRELGGCWSLPCPFLTPPHQCLNISVFPPPNSYPTFAFMALMKLAIKVVVKQLGFHNTNGGIC